MNKNLLKNPNRRKLLKFLLIGSGILVLGKIFGSRLFGSSGSKEEYLFENFRVTEDKKELIIYDKTGEKIFIIEK